MNFGSAVEQLKAVPGTQIARSGWNGKGMFLFLVTPLPAFNPSYRQHPYFTLRTPDGSLQSGWNASTPDVLAEDWCIVEGT